VLFFCKCAEVCELRMRYGDLFKGMLKTACVCSFLSLHIHQFHVSSSFCVFCLARCSLDFLAFLVWLQAFFQASAQMPTRGIYSDVTLPYLKTACVCSFEL
jgi:hypothetical protein